MEGGPGHPQESRLGVPALWARSHVSPFSASIVSITPPSHGPSGAVSHQRRSGGRENASALSKQGGCFSLETCCSSEISRLRGRVNHRARTGSWLPFWSGDFCRPVTATLRKLLSLVVRRTRNRRFSLGIGGGILFFLPRTLMTFCDAARLDNKAANSSKTLFQVNGLKLQHLEPAASETVLRVQHGNTNSKTQPPVPGKILSLARLQRIRVKLSETHSSDVTVGISRQERQTWWYLPLGQLRQC